MQARSAVTMLMAVSFASIWLPACGDPFHFSHLDGEAGLVGVTILGSYWLAVLFFIVACAISFLALEYVVWSLVDRRRVPAIVILSVGAVCGLCCAWLGVTIYDAILEYSFEFRPIQLRIASFFFFIGFAVPAVTAALVFLIVEIVKAIAASRRSKAAPQPRERRTLATRLGVVLLVYHGSIIPIAAVVGSLKLLRLPSGADQRGLLQAALYWLGLLALSLPSFAAAAGILHRRRFGPTLATVSSCAAILAIAIGYLAGVDAIGTGSFVLCAVPAFAVLASTRSSVRSASDRGTVN